MKNLIKDWWPLLIVAVWWLWKKSGKPVANAQEPTAAAQPTATATTTATQPTASPVVSADGGTVTLNGTTYYAPGYYTGGPIGKTSWDDAAAERAKYNSCPVHGTSTMRHIHTYNGGHVEDYYQCTVCGHRNTVYVKDLNQ